MNAFLLSALIYLAIIAASAVLAFGATTLWANTSAQSDPFVAAFLILPGFWLLFSLIGILAYHFWT